MKLYILLSLTRALDSAHSGVVVRAGQLDEGGELPPLRRADFFFVPRAVWASRLGVKQRALVIRSVSD